MERLLEELADPDNANWEATERQIEAIWSRSGSAAMDLLLERGRKALEAEEFDAAIEHLTALIDHAPDFAEAYNARALAYFHKGLHGPALDDLARALALNPRHFGALVGVAVMFEEIGMQEAALEAWRALEAIHPHHPQLREALERLEKATAGTAL
ncbi:tetratricopeptide repeat protein [Meinhardsimonia xiamenensis]|uniref:tetratricopeptide repeat protein n=1 Tax=Meinhardsimonia xiamenensis TaxID=990712 RepID=UPI000AD587FC|nr:tetratricopeptide repeat protein [Meinhardsimonia xiamenensis]